MQDYNTIIGVLTMRHNQCSLRVMEKNGARCVGEDEEHFFMRIYK